MHTIKTLREPFSLAPRSLLFFCESAFYGGHRQPAGPRAAEENLNLASRISFTFT